MTRLQYTVTVVALDRARLHGYTVPVCDLVEATRARGHAVVLPDGQTVPDVRLVKGRHLRPGARYESTGSDPGERVTTVLREWRRVDVLALEQFVRSPEFGARIAVRLRCPERPAALDVEARIRGAEGSGALHRLRGKASLDLRAWWAAASAAPGTPSAARAPATVRLTHRLGVARLYLRPRPAGPDRWDVDVTLTLHGRSLLRPVAGLALLLARVPLRRGFRTSVEEAARQWNEALGRVLAHDPDEFRAELASYMVRRPKADGPAPQAEEKSAGPDGTVG
ncbi:hypothetical protein [Streptomyces sp. NPDC052042]|uniref:hypothetical protein n=1 Tax=Streptomyces sp. NPDC052042 TaxID=3365683 RepID=UPI0037D5B07C